MERVTRWIFLVGIIFIFDATNWSTWDWNVCPMYYYSKSSLSTAARPHNYIYADDSIGDPIVPPIIPSRQWPGSIAIYSEPMVLNSIPLAPVPMFTPASRVPALSSTTIQDDGEDMHSWRVPGPGVAKTYISSTSFWKIWPNFSLLTRAITWDWPLGVSVYIRISSAGTLPFSFATQSSASK